MNSEKDTLPNNQIIFDAIKELQTVVIGLNTKIENLHSEMNARFEQVDKRFEQVDKRFEYSESKSEDMRLQMMSFDVRIDRVEASVHEVLNVSINTRADVKVLREEIYNWSKEVQDLQLKIA